MKRRNRGCNQNLALVLSLAMLVLIASCRHVQTAVPPTSIIVFEGTLEKLAPDLGILSGGIAVYRLAKYRVETICQGKYKGKEIVVDHLVLSGHEFENINIGDRVSVTVQVSDKVLARYDADGIRNSSDTVEMFYVGMEDIKRSHSGSNCYYTPR